MEALNSLRMSLAKWFAPRAPTDPASDARALDAGNLWPSFGAFGGDRILPTLSPTAAFQIPGVSAAVQLLSQEVATLPLKIFLVTDDERTEAVRHPAYRLLRWQPNSLMTASRWRETAMIHVCLYGNSYTEIEYDSVGRPRALWLLEPWKVEVFANENQRELAYVYQPENGERRVIVPDDMLHIRWLTSHSGLIGESPVVRCSDAVGLTEAASGFATRFYSSGAHLSGVLTHPGTLSESSFATIKESWRETHTGQVNAHSVAILEEGMEWTPTSISPEDGQMLPTREFQIGEVARIFGVPSFRLGGATDRNTYSNVEQETIAFYRNSLRPILTNWEQEIDMKLLTRNFFSDFDMREVLRPDVITRFRSYESAINTGWLSKNEVRKLEGLNEVEGLDVDPAAAAEVENVEVVEVDDDDDDDTRAIVPMLVATIERVLTRQRRALTGADDVKVGRFFETQAEVWAEALGPWLESAALLGADIPDFTADELGSRFAECHQEELAKAGANWNGLLWNAADLTEEVLSELR